MKKESSTNLQKYSGIAEQMVKMSSDCPKITKMILDIIYVDDCISRDRQKVIIKKKMKYEYKGNIYNYVGVGKFKDSTGKWIDAIIYERDNHVYMREITDFIDKFKKA